MHCSLTQLFLQQALRNPAEAVTPCAESPPGRRTPGI
jgi:hypothetical protein